jgi:hypothetical protein
MKTFIQFIVEMDPNRGAPGRATPIAGHYASSSEVDAAHKQARSEGRPLPGNASNINTKIDQLKRIGDKNAANRLAGWKAGKAGTDRFRGPYVTADGSTDGTQQEAEVAHAAYELGQTARDPNRTANRIKIRRNLMLDNLRKQAAGGGTT